MANYKDQIRDIWKKYRAEVSTAPVDLKDVAAWAIKKSLWKPRAIDLHASLAGVKFLGSYPAVGTHGDDRRREAGSLPGDH